MLNAADDLLVERGFSGVTMEGIAARAGVAKQTIYRWWKSKVDILLDTLAADAEEPLAWRPGSPPASPEEELRDQLGRVAAFLQEPAGQVLLSLIGHAQLDPETAAKLRDGFLREQRERDLAGLGALLARHTGRPADERLTARLLDAALGPLFHQALVLGRPSGPAALAATARLVLDAAEREQAKGDAGSRPGEPAAP
ncbi:TetR/AcrR family transcriptional regulator [Nonomuraea sp. NPDC050691]|uniref:TetR/AcrR family transcriptional regulator n=1 Tax=Nonomuraea sp. NPDC050691 TaxID=3155661 RepID=UPI0033D9F333